jgi:hypothetical protein
MVRLPAIAVHAIGQQCAGPDSAVIKGKFVATLRNAQSFQMGQPMAVEFCECCGKLSDTDCERITRAAQAALVSEGTPRIKELIEATTR